MGCLSATLSGIALDCGSIGGLKNIYIIDVLDVERIEINNSIITGINIFNDKIFKQYSFSKGNAKLESINNTDYINDTSYYEVSVDVTFNKMNSYDRFELQKLTRVNIYVIALDNNGKYHFIGYDSYATANVDGKTGMNMGDSNSYDLTITSMTKELPHIIDNNAALVAIGVINNDSNTYVVDDYVENYFV